MAEWTYKIGAPSTEGSNNLRWDTLSALIDSDLVDGGGAAYLRVLRVYSISWCRLYTSTTASRSSFFSGPDLTSVAERNAYAITISAGNLTLVLPGPGHTGNAYRDSSEPYAFLPPQATRNKIATFITAYRLLSSAQKGETTLTLSDSTPTPKLSIAADISTITEGSDAIFALSSSIAPANNLTVNITVTETGDVISGATPTTATIRAGQTAATITIPTAADPLGTGEQGSITVTISASAEYDISTPSHTINVLNYIPPPVLSIATDISTITEGTDAVFTLSSSIAPANNLTVNITVTETGDVISGATPTTATIRAGHTAATITIPTDDDTTNEPNSTIEVTISTGRGYMVGSDASASVVVQDDEVDLDEVLTHLHLTPVPLIDISLRDGASLKHLYASNRSITVSGKKYLDILSKNGLSDISHDLDGIGGIATISSATIRLQNATGDADIPLSQVLDQYDLVGQSVMIRYLFLPATEAVQVWSGRVSHLTIAGDAIILSAINTTLDDIIPVPSRVYSLTETPNLPLSSAGLPHPLVFGVLNSAEKKVLAPGIRIDAFSHQYTTAVRARQRGNVYILPRDRDLSRASATQSGDRITLSDSGTLITSRQLPDIYYQPRVSTRRITRYFLGAWRADGTTGVRGITVSGRVTTRGGPRTSRGQEIRRRMGMSTSIFVRGELSHRAYYFPINTHEPGEGVRTKTHTYSNTLAIEGSNRDIPLGDWEIRILPFTDGGGGEFVDASLTVSVSHSYNIDDLDPPRIFQAITGYEDRASNYMDGPAVNTDGMTLSHPVDIAHALLRDKDYGMSQKSGSIDRSDIDFQRIAAGESRRFDFVMRDIMDFDAHSDLLRQGGLFMVHQPGATANRKIQAAGANGPVSVFTHKWNIIGDSFSTESSPLRDVKNHYFLRYGYSHVEEKFTKALIRSGQRSGSGRGNLLSTGRFSVTSTPPPPMAIGDRLFFGNQYYIITKTISQNTCEVRRENGGPIRAAQNLPFDVGPYFDKTCYDSEQKYGRKSYLGNQTAAIESRYIQDDGTARAFLNDLIGYHAEVAKNLRFSTDMSAIRLSVGDEIIVDHPYSRGIEKIGTLSSTLSRSATSIAWTLDAGVTVKLLDYILLQSGVHFEVLRSGGGTSVSREHMNSAARQWPRGTTVYRALHTYIVTHTTLSPTSGRIDIRARELDAADIYDTPFPPSGQSAEQVEPPPPPALTIDGEAITIDGEYTIILP